MKLTINSETYFGEISDPAMDDGGMIVFLHHTFFNHLSIRFTAEQVAQIVAAATPRRPIGRPFASLDARHELALRLMAERGQIRVKDFAVALGEYRQVKYFAKKKRQSGPYSHARWVLNRMILEQMAELVTVSRAVTWYSITEKGTQYLKSLSEHEQTNIISDAALRP